MRDELLNETLFIECGLHAIRDRAARLGGSSVLTLERGGNRLEL